MKTEKELIQSLDALLGESRILLQSIVTFMGSLAEKNKKKSIIQSDWDQLFAIQNEATNLVEKISNELEVLVVKK